MTFSNAVAPKSKSRSPQGQANATTEWLALKSRIEQFVTLEKSCVELGGQQLDWYRVTDGQRLLDNAVTATRAPEEFDPFWAATWRAAQGLDRFLARYELNRLRILELGCGSGQAGVGAAHRGALVTLTDAVGIALLVARLNAWPVRHRVTVRRLKWTHTRLNQQRFPLIIGSDIVYDPNLFPLIDQCARQHLAVSGRLLLSEPHRHTGDRFANWIRQAGWQTQEHDVSLGDARVPIRIFECWLD